MENCNFEKKHFGCGITPQATLPFLIQALVSPEDITIRGCEVFEKDGDTYKSLATASSIPCSALVLEIDKPVLMHSGVYTPKPYSENKIIHGPAFGLREEYYLLPRDAVTLNKSIESEGVSQRTLWDAHSSILVTMDEFGRIRVPYNKYPHTQRSKVDSPSLIMEKYVNVIAQIYVGHHEDDFSHDGLRLTVHPDFGYDSNIVFDQVVPNVNAAYSAFGNTYLPQMTAPGQMECDAGGVVEIPVTVQRPDGSLYSGECSVYTKTDLGLVVTRKVTAVDGAAVVRYMALGLEPGDTAEVKIGFKWYDNKATTQVTVI